jgi:hypothetical protein
MKPTPKTLQIFLPDWALPIHFNAIKAHDLRIF